MSSSRTGGFGEVLLLRLCLSFFFFDVSFRCHDPAPPSPLGVPDGFGEDVVSPVQVHDAVLQVEFPFVLTSVNLGRAETNGCRGGHREILSTLKRSSSPQYPDVHSIAKVQPSGA